METPGRTLGEYLDLVHSYSGSDVHRDSAAMGMDDVGTSFDRRDD